MSYMLNNVCTCYRCQPFFVNINVRSKTKSLLFPNPEPTSLTWSQNGGSGASEWLADGAGEGPSELKKDSPMGH